MTAEPLGREQTITGHPDGSTTWHVLDVFPNRQRRHLRAGTEFTAVAESLFAPGIDGGWSGWTGTPARWVFGHAAQKPGSPVRIRATLASDPKVVALVAPKAVTTVHRTRKATP